MKQSWLTFVLVAAALSAALIIVGTTPHGPGVTPDSTIYLESAQSLASGSGFSARGEAMTRYPPAFPILLAAGGAIFGDTLVGARVLLALLFGANLFLVSLTAYRGGGRLPAAAFAGALLFASSPDLLELHVAALSEPLFLCCSLLAVLFLARYLSQGRSALLIASGVFLALALTTRYAAIPLVFPMLLAIWTFGPDRVSRRVRDLFVLGVIGGTPFALWVVRNLLTAGTAAEREIGFRGSPISLVPRTVRAIHDFWLPLAIGGRFKLVLLLLLAAALAAGPVLARRAWPRGGEETREPRALLTMWGLFAGLYLAFVIATVTFLDAHTPVDRRILAPFNTAVLILVAALGGTVIRFARWRSLKWALAGMLLFVVSLRAGRFMTLSERVRSEGYGYTAPVWKSSETVAHVKSLSPSTVVYSNGPDALRFLTGRAVNPVPRKIHPNTKKRNARFEKEVAPLCTEVGSGAVLVYLEKIRWRWYLPTHAELAVRCGLGRPRVLPDGVIYGE
ncbi:MAG: ArnT family glycosyltransferase [Thermoanaerobaculia bacterium]